MARYTNLFNTPERTQDPHRSIAEALENCDLNLVYETKDYVVAQEKPGEVSYSQLATVEVLINPPTKDETHTKVNLVVKNEELPLRAENHCQQVFEAVKRAISAANYCVVA